MSRKQSSKPVRGNKKYEVERKRDERASRRALARERKNRPQGEDEGEEFISFTNQLQVLGLRLREVPGDGNCLFRALADQLEGHSRGHLRLRQETVQYMQTHRHDFEPFMEDGVPFTQHVANLSQPGTFAGNDAIVAFARCRQLRVVIHQLNAPLWEINGGEKPVCRELHIAYRYGDHYDSIRRIGDNSETPAQLRIENLNQTTGQSSPVPLQSTLTLSEEEELILSCLTSPNPEELAQMCPAQWEECAAESRLCLSAVPNQSKGKREQAETSSSSSHKPKITNKQRKEQQRLDKKKRQEERHKQKVLQSKSPPALNLSSPDPVTLVPAFTTLSI